MSQNINFPSVNVPILSANSPIENSEQKVLFVGHSLPIATTDTLYQNVPNSTTEINALFGEGSLLSQMLISARKINKVVHFDVISASANAEILDLGGATLTLTGIAPSGTSIDIVLGSKIDGTFSVPVTLADDSTAMATKISDYINLAANNIGNKLGFTASSALGVVTILSKTGGNLTNGISLKATSSDPAVTVVVLGFLTNAIGSGEPNLTSTLDLIGEERYQTIVYPFIEESIVSLIPVLDARFNANDDVLDGVGITGSYGDLAFILSDLNQFNSKSIVYIAQEHKTVSAEEESTAIFEFPWNVIAQFAAIRSLRRQPDANISDLVISRNGALDSVGGPALSSKPYANTPMSLLPLVQVGRGFLKTEIKQINDAGGTVFGNNKSKSSIVMGQVVTTYLTDISGDPDDSFKYLNYVDTASTAREYFFNNLASRYAQSRLTDGNLIQGRDMTNEENIKAEMVGFYQTLSDIDYVVARKGENILQFFKENLSVSIDLLTGTANITFSLPIVTQLRDINAPMQLTFNIE